MIKKLNSDLTNNDGFQFRPCHRIFQDQLPSVDSFSNRLQFRIRRFFRYLSNQSRLFSRIQLEIEALKCLSLKVKHFFAILDFQA